VPDGKYKRVVIVLIQIDQGWDPTCSEALIKQLVPVFGYQNKVALKNSNTFHVLGDVLDVEPAGLVACCDSDSDALLTGMSVHVSLCVG
jgi:hypothetical protein